MIIKIKMFFKKIKIIDNLFAISLILLSQFSYRDYNLGKYQIVVTIFWISGLLKFKNPDSSLEESLKDSQKDLIVSIVSVPLLYWIGNGGEIDMFLFGPISQLVHYIILRIFFRYLKREIKSKGIGAVYSYTIVPILVIFLLKSGVPITISTFMAISMAEFYNKIYYKKKI